MANVDQHMDHDGRDLRSSPAAGRHRGQDTLAEVIMIRPACSHRDGLIGSLGHHGAGIRLPACPGDVGAIVPPVRRRRLLLSRSRRPGLLTTLPEAEPGVALANAPATSGRPPSAGPGRDNRPLVLVVDDEESYRQALASGLTREGFAVEVGRRRPRGAAPVPPGAPRSRPARRHAARPVRHRDLSADAEPQARAHHHGDRTRLGGRHRARAGARRQRLRGEAVPAARAGRPHAGRAAPGRGRRRAPRGGPHRGPGPPRCRPPRGDGQRGRRSTSPARSSTSSPS